MKQLLLTDFIGYMPFGLQFNYDGSIITAKHYYKLDKIYLCISPIETGFGNSIIINGEVTLKPILNPIEEIFNIPEIMDEFTEEDFYLFTDEALKKEYNSDEYDTLEHLSAKQLLLCYKHHIDVFKLIDNRLALNKKDYL